MAQRLLNIAARRALVGDLLTRYVTTLPAARLRNANPGFAISDAYLYCATLLFGDKVTAFVLVWGSTGAGRWPWAADLDEGLPSRKAGCGARRSQLPDASFQTLPDNDLVTNAATAVGRALDTEVANGSFDILLITCGPRCAGGQGCDSVEAAPVRDLSHHCRTLRRWRAVRALVQAGIEQSPPGGGRTSDCFQAPDTGRPCRLLCDALEASPISCCSSCCRRPDPRRLGWPRRCRSGAGTDTSDATIATAHHAVGLRSRHRTACGTCRARTSVPGSRW